ncbi:O-antigen ligase family protein [Sporomusa sphaeroides]|uniref:O-antigen ligase family protein n=1 Tax=Sporomusa sphaeroides TaxID=47679 RepID=UPI002B6BEE58|nr:O-antigen ligase family protein [Sporomusa sphaeroides]HML34135.1 O-antigen ligase family protein [Sporomusa sphaeroides]
MNNIERLDTLIFWSLCGYALTFTISVAAANFFVILGSILAVIRTFKAMPVISVPQQYIRPMLLFFGTMAGLALISDDYSAAIDRVWGFTGRMMPFLLVLAFLKEKSQIAKLLLFMTVALMFADLYAIWQGLHGNYRAGSFGNHTMDFAGILVQFIPILFIAVLDYKWMQYRRYLLFVLTFSVIAMLFNGTRIIWIAVSVLLPLLLILYYQSIKKVFPYIVVSLILVGILVSSVPLLHTRVVTLTDMSYQSNSERVLMWKSAWAMFCDHPLTGVGLGQYPYYYQTEYMSPLAKEIHQRHAHNNFLQMLAETGLIGFTAYCLMMGSILYYSFSDWLHSRDTSSLMFFAATLGVGIQSLTDFNFGLNKMMRLYFCLMAMYLQYRYLPTGRSDNTDVEKT